MKQKPQLKFGSRRTERQKDRVKQQVRMYRALAVQFLGGLCRRCKTTKDLEIHHRNGDYKNNEPENLELLCHECHKQANRENGTMGRPRRHIPSPLKPKTPRQTSCTEHTKYRKGCVDCKVANKKWRDENRQRIRDAQNARWARLHEEINAQRRKRYKQNPGIKENALAWRDKHQVRWREIQRASYYKHHENRKQRMQKRRQLNPERTRLETKLAYQTLRVAALTLLGGKCVVCGIADFRILNANHKRGGGTLQLNELGPWKVYRGIVTGQLPKEDFDCRCYNHNILYEYEVGRRIWLLHNPVEAYPSPNDHRRYLYQQKRVRLINYLGGKCIDCGHTDIRILTINHLQGGGVKAFRSATSENQYYTDILNGKMSRELFDVRCPNHNILFEYQVGRRKWLSDSKQNKFGAEKSAEGGNLWERLTYQVSPLSDGVA